MKHPYMKIVTIFEQKTYLISLVVGTPNNYENSILFLNDITFEFWSTTGQVDGTAGRVYQHNSMPR